MKFILIKIRSCLAEVSHQEQACHGQAKDSTQPILRLRSTCFLPGKQLQTVWWETHIPSTALQVNAKF